MLVNNKKMSDRCCHSLSRFSHVVMFSFLSVSHMIHTGAGPCVWVGHINQCHTMSPYFNSGWSRSSLGLLSECLWPWTLWGKDHLLHDSEDSCSWVDSLFARLQNEFRTYERPPGCAAYVILFLNRCILVPFCHITIYVFVIYIHRRISQNVSDVLNKWERMRKP